MTHASDSAPEYVLFSWRLERCCYELFVRFYSQKDSPVEERVNELKSQPPSDSSSSHADETSTPPSSDGVGEQQEEEDKTKKADRIKEEGNVSFKAKKYDEAIDLYTKAIGAFLTMFLTGKHCVDYGNIN